MPAQEEEWPTLEGPRADITGKEPVPVRDWDQDTLVRAILAGQRDIIEDEINHLLGSTYWQTPRAEEFEHKFKRVPADIVAKTLDMCRLDAIPVYSTVSVPMGEIDVTQQIDLVTANTIPVPTGRR